MTRSTSLAAGSVIIFHSSESGLGADRLAGLAGRKPSALFRGDDAGCHRVGDAEPQDHRAELVPDAYPLCRGETAGIGIDGMHQQRRRSVAGAEHR